MIKTGVFITRKWGEANIEVAIYKRGEMVDGTFISLYADLDTFKQMLAEELKKHGDIDTAVNEVLKDIKEVTSRVVK